MRVTDEVMPGVVALPHGWGHRGGWQVANAAGGVNVNQLMSAEPEDLEPLAGMAFLNGVPVRVEPVAAARPEGDERRRRACPSPRASETRAPAAPPVAAGVLSATVAATTGDGSLARVLGVVVGRAGLGAASRRPARPARPWPAVSSTPASSPRSASSAVSSGAIAPPLASVPSLGSPPPASAAAVGVAGHGLAADRRGRGSRRSG